MLTSTAFFAAGLILVAFGFTSSRVASATATQSNYFSAYLLLALAFFGYSLGALVGNDASLEYAILIGNFLIFLGSGFLVGELLKSPAVVTLPASALFATVFCGIRALWFYPEPEIVDGILFFNTQPLMGILFAGLFATVWLPANLQFAQNISKAVNLEDIYVIYAALFTFATTSAVFFLAANTSLLVAISFATISASFAALATVNMVTRKFYRSRQKKTTTKAKTK